MSAPTGLAAVLAARRLQAPHGRCVCGGVLTAQGRCTRLLAALQAAGR